MFETVMVSSEYESADDEQITSFHPLCCLLRRLIPELKILSVKHTSIIF